MGVATLGGGFIGYEVGHRADPDTSNEKFIEHLKDSETWKAVNKDFLVVYMSDLREAISGTIDDKDIAADRAVMEGLRKMHPEIWAAAKAEGARIVNKDEEQERVAASRKSSKTTQPIRQKASQPPTRLKSE